jgi:uncharacterized protein
VKKAKPATPLSTDEGPVTEIVTEIDWKAVSGNAGIKPGEFDSFVLSAGPLPKVATLTFKALQTYSDGKVASWIDVAAPGSTAEPEHPAPSISLAEVAGPDGQPSSAAASATTAAAQQDSGTSGLSVAAFIVGVAASLLAVAGLFWILTVGNKLRRGSSTA